MLSRLVRAMDASASTHLVVSMTDQGAVADELRAAGIEVRHLGLQRGQVAAWPVATVRRWVHDWNADVLQTWMYHADLLGTAVRLTGARPRLVWNLRASNIDMRQYRPLSGWTRSLCARLSRWPVLVIANSDAGVQAHTALGYRPRAWEVVPNGIDTDEFAPRPLLRHAVRASMGIPDEAVVVGVTARYDPMKGHDVLARVATTWLPTRPDVHVVVAGAGVQWDAPDYAAVAAAAPGVVGRVHLLGLRHDVADLWAACDVACSPSHGEGFANAIAEAMACGVPVVATDAGDSSVIVGNPTCLVPVGDPAALAAGLDRLTSLPRADRERLGQAARHRVISEYGLARVASRYLEIYRGLIAG